MSLSEFYWPAREIRTAAFGWLAFLFCASIYCIVYNQMVLLTADSFVNSFAWSLREYAHWLLITPILLVLLQFHSHKSVAANNRHLLKVLTFTLLIAWFSRVLIEIYLNPSTSIAASLVYFFPGQMCTLAIITILWKLSRQTKKCPEEINNQENQKKPADKVLVMKGTGEKLITWDSVLFINAAGNYLELVTREDTYLLRATMKQLANELPLDKFIRIHRSYIANISQIEKITSNIGGNGLILLSNGQELPLSKSYKKLLKPYKLMID
jgi:hypothetical protein